MKMTSKDFKEKWEKSGQKMNSKGRPIIPELVQDGGNQQESGLKSTMGSSPKGLTNEVVMPFPYASEGNKKVRGAKKIYDEKGEKLADSKWEYTCMRMLEMAGLKPEKQRAFEILPTIRERGCKRTLQARKWYPDFTFEDLKIVADAKGWTTEVARLKMHMFLDRYFLWSVYVLKTEKDVYDLIEIIKNKRYDIS